MRFARNKNRGEAMLMMPEIVRLNIQLTKKCNQRCCSCNSYELDCGNELALDEFKRVIQEATTMFAIKNIAFTGGEPTLFPDFCSLASFARSYSPFVSVTTNGYYCSTRQRTKELVYAGVNRFSFSYHGVGIHDDFTRVKGCEERLIKAIDWLNEEKRKNDIYIKVGTLFTGDNIQDVEKVLDFAESKDSDLYIEVFDDRISLFSSSLLSEEKKRIVEEAVLNKALEKILSWKKLGRRVLIDKRGVDFINQWFKGEILLGECPLWNTDIYIESNGSVRTGCWVLPAVGNIREKSLEEIVNGEQYKKNIENMKLRKCNGCTCGYLAQAKYLN